MKERMLKKIFALMLLCVLSCLVFAAEPNSSGKNHIKWMTFWDYEPNDYNGNVNLFFTRDVSEILKTSKLGMTNLLRLEEVFTVSLPLKQEKHARRSLRSDYKNTWKACSELIRPLYEKNVLQGFVLGDELLWGGLSQQDLEKIAEAVRQAFPKAIIYYNEARKPITDNKNIYGETIEFTKFPASIDWVSFDYYVKAGITLVRPWYENCLYPKMHEHQKAFIVPQSYTSDPNKIIDESEMISVVNDYYEWAKADQRIIGIAPWHWRSYPKRDLQWKYGAQHMPVLRARWNEIGKEVVAANVDGVKSTFSELPAQSFESFSNGDPLPSTYSWDQLGIITAPEKEKVFFSSEKAHSGKISIRLNAADSEFRYSWGTGYSWNTDIIPSKHRCGFYVAFDKAQSDINVVPTFFKVDGSPCVLILGKSGLSLVTGTGTIKILDESQFKPQDWNKIVFEIDFNPDRAQDKITIMVNQKTVYDSLFTPIKKTSFTHVGFRGGPCLIDDIGIDYVEPGKN